MSTGRKYGLEWIRIRAGMYRAQSAEDWWVHVVRRGRRWDIYRDIDGFCGSASTLDTAMFEASRGLDSIHALPKAAP